MIVIIIPTRRNLTFNLFRFLKLILKSLYHGYYYMVLPYFYQQLGERVSSVVEHSSANPKVPSLIPGPVSYRGHGL